MDTEFDEKGKIFTDVITKVPIRAKIQTTTHLIVGAVHVRRESRIKDDLDVNEQFLAVTDAKLYTLDGQQLYSTAFLAVQRSQIVWVMPVEEEQKAGTQ
jgi:hypothetical protein